MTVKELKKLLEDIDDNKVVAIGPNCTSDCYHLLREIEESPWSSDQSAPENSSENPPIVELGWPNQANHTEYLDPVEEGATPIIVLWTF